MCKNNCIAFKGSKDGITIYLDRDSDYANLKEQLIKKLESTRQFFIGAQVSSIQGKALTNGEREEIREIIYSRFGMVMVEKNEGVMGSSSVQPFDGIEEGDTKFIRATIRSGQRIQYGGNIVIIGDVNPGAEIIAEGNILVMGALRGLAHAGSSGNERAFVVAYSLQPKQLRIANIIARSPDHEQVKPMSPELAMIKNDVVVIEPYLPNR